MSRYSDLIRDTTGLVGYWRLGESSGTVANEVNNGDPGTYTASPTLGVAGAIINDTDTAVTFAAASLQYVALSNTGRGFNNGPYSFEAWFKSTGSGANFAILDVDALSGAAGDIGFGLGNLANGKVSVWDGANRIISSGATLYNDGVYHHCVVTKTTANVWKLYVDGVDVTVNDSTPNVATTSDLTSKNGRIGVQYNAGAQRWFFTGTLDEIAIYNVELTLAQAQQHYGAGKSGFEAFQPDSFQNDTYQNLIEFFQADAFQNDTFQVDISAFDTAVTFQGDAFQPATSLSVSASAEVATGTGAATNPSIFVTPNAGQATGTGTANDPKAGVQPAAGVAAGTGVANAPTLSLGPTSQAATGTGTANTPTGTVQPAAGAATGTGAANAPTGAIRPGAGVGAGTGAANTPAAQVSGVSGVATGSGVAGAPSAGVTALGGIATGTGTAFDPTVLISGDVIANAGIATGTGTAFDATVITSSPGGGAVANPGYAKQVRRDMTRKPVQSEREFAMEVLAQAGMAVGRGEAFSPTVIAVDNAQDEMDIEALLVLA